MHAWRRAKDMSTSLECKSILFQQFKQRLTVSPTFLGSIQLKVSRAHARYDDVVNSSQVVLCSTNTRARSRWTMFL